jgi:protein tyrosine phosphatase
LRSTQNKPKNRYLNVVAPDHSLVTLHYPAAGADSSATRAAYINANFCDSLIASRTGHQRYIATQGPLPDTVADFWFMCWQENVSVITMLTLCVEKDKVKCEQYWPEANGEFVDAESLYGVMNVRLLQRGGDARIIERRFLLTNTVEKRSREVVHFLFTEWPDWGCPENADSFLRLVDMVDEHNVSSGPLVVHCSAGIGRTGTFCTVHSALEKYRAERGAAPPSSGARTVRATTEGFADAQLPLSPRSSTKTARSPVDVLNASIRRDENGPPPSDRSEAPPAPPPVVAFESRDGSKPRAVSVVRIVAHLRGGRPAMVQTKEQLEFAYTALVTALERESAVVKQANSTLRGAAKRMPPLRARQFLDPWRGDAALYVDPSTSHTRAGVVWSRIASAALELPRASAPAPTPIVSQGALGDAWFLGALATVATRPELLDGLSYDHDAAEFRCRFFKDGAWRTVLVDDRVPCFAESSVPVFACATAGTDNWVALVEKAYAKLHGCYQALEGGTLLQGMVDLTGGAPERIDVAPQGDTDSLWARLLDAEVHRWPLAFLRTARASTLHDEELVSAVQANRAYPFVRTALRDGERLVIVRDPWLHEDDESVKTEPLPATGAATTANSASAAPAPATPAASTDDAPPPLLSRVSGRLEEDVLVAVGVAKTIGGAADPAPTADRDDCLIVLTLEKLCVAFDRVFLCRTRADAEWDDAVDSEFAITNGTAGGSPKHDTWKNNPRFLLRVPPACHEVFIVMTQPDSRPWHVDGKVSNGVSEASPATLRARRDTELSPFAVATAAAFAANAAAGEVPGLPRFSIGLHVVRCDDNGDIDTTLARDATLARTAYSKVREVGLSLVLPPNQCVLVPATSRPDCEMPFRIVAYGEGVTLERLPASANPRRTIEGEWRGGAAGGSFAHVTWRDNPQFSFALQERLRVRVTLEQLAAEGEPLLPIGFVLLLGTRRRRVVASPSLTPAVSRDGTAATTVRILTDTAIAAQAQSLAAPAGATSAADAAGDADGALESTPSTSRKTTRQLVAPLGAVLAVVGFNAKREVSLDLDLKARRLLAPDERHGNVVVVPSTSDPRQERRFRITLEAHPAPPKLTPCVDWPTEVRVTGEWDAHSAGGGSSTPLWRANTQFRITNVRNPCVARIVLRRIDDGDGDAAASNSGEASTSRRYTASTTNTHMGLHVLRGAADAQADELHAETEVARSNFEASTEVAVVVNLTPLPRAQAYYVLPCTYRANTYARYAVTVFADEPGLTLERAERGSRRMLAGAWTAARAGGCANTDNWIKNPHVRIRFAAPGGGPAQGTVHVLLVPAKEVGARGAGFYVTQRSPSECSIADIVRLPDVKFVVGDHISMSFYSIPHDRDLFVVPCTFEPDVLGPYTLLVRADTAFDLQIANPE